MPSAKQYSLTAGVLVAVALLSLGDESTGVHNREGGELVEVVEMEAGGKYTVVGVATLQEVHTEGKEHRGVWVYVSDVEGKVFLIKRAPHMKTCPSAWVTIGEHCKEEETWREAALRGLHEELGWTVPALSPSLAKVTEPFIFNNTYSNGKVDRQWTVIFHLKLDTPPPKFALSEEEIAESTWARPDEFAAEKLSMSHPQCDVYTQRMVFEFGLKKVAARL